VDFSIILVDRLPEAKTYGLLYSRASAENFSGEEGNEKNTEN